MFIGIVEETGEVISLTPRADSAVLRVRAHVVGSDVRHGASIAVNGVCLTVVGINPLNSSNSSNSSNSAISSGAVQVVGSNEAPGTASAPYELDFDVMAETLHRSDIGDLRAGYRVNLERAATVGARIDGHIVQGHVDGTGALLNREPHPAWDSVRFGLPAELARYVAEKGSIAVDGVSLTVTAVGDDWFEVGLIPETLAATVLGSKIVGERVNIEVDVLAKYTERLLSSRAAGLGLVADA